MNQTKSNKNAMFFYSILDDEVAAQSGYQPRVMIVSPEYGASLTLVNQLVAALRAKLREAPSLQFTDEGDSAVTIYKGNFGTYYQKLHVSLLITLRVSAEEARQALNNAGFNPGLPGRYI